MVLNQYTVVDHGNVWRDAHLAVFVEMRCGVNHIVSLPFARAHGRVYEGHCLLVDRASLTVRISRVVVAVEYLQFVNALHENTAVTTALSVSVYFGGCSPFDVQLVVAEGLFGLDVA
ncbi:hypothetical protein D3C86_1811150 [compost metagenome]